MFLRQETQLLVRGPPLSQALYHRNQSTELATSSHDGINGGLTSNGASSIYLAPLLVVIFMFGVIIL